MLPNFAWKHDDWTWTEIKQLQNIRSERQLSYFQFFIFIFLFFSMVSKNSYIVQLSYELLFMELDRCGHWELSLYGIKLFFCFFYVFLDNLLL